MPLLLLALLAVVSAALLTAGGTDRRQEPAARRLARYLERSATPAGRYAALAAADRYVRRMPGGMALERHIIQAGISVPVSLVMCGVASVAAGAAGMAATIGGPAFGAGAAAAAVLAGHAALQAARLRRVHRMEMQFPAGLDLLVGQLRAHRSIGEAVADVAHWIPAPLGGEFTRVAEELRIGVPLPEALDRLRERVPVPAIAAVTTAIVVAERTGANLADCLGRQSAAARAQIAFRHEVRAMTAHARATGAMLACLPVVVAAAMLALEPEVFAPMIATTPGRVLLGTACVMEFTGWQAIRWMIRRVET